MMKKKLEKNVGQHLGQTDKQTNRQTDRHTGSDVELRSATKNGLCQAAGYIKYVKLDIYLPAITII